MAWTDPCHVPDFGCFVFTAQLDSFKLSQIVALSYQFGNMGIDTGLEWRDLEGI